MTLLAQHWAGKPLAIQPAALAALMQMQTLTPDASRFVGERAAGGAYRVTQNGTAIITIQGALLNRGMIVGENWGLATYEGLSFKITQAARDPKVKAIVLDFDSAGGEAAGAVELSALVRKINAIKPVFAHVGGLAASAAYAIASGARAIASLPSGMSGSIGVVLMHIDVSRALDEAGISPSLIFAGKRKVDANPFEPLPKGVRADLQTEVDKFHALFIDCVAAGRGARLSADAARATEARTFIGADAKRIGLVDEICSFAELLAAVERRAS